MKPAASTDVLRIPVRPFVPVVALGLAQAAAIAGLLLLVRAFVDDLVGANGSGGTSALRWVAAIVPLLLLASAVFPAVEFRLGERIGYEFVRRVRAAMYVQLRGLSPRQLQHRSRGSLLLRFTGDLTMFRTWVSRGLARGIVSATVIVAGAGVLFVLDAVLALTLLATLGAGSAVSLRLGRRLRGITRVVRRRRSLLTSTVDEQIHSLAVVQAFGRVRGETLRFGRQNDRLTRALIREAGIRAELRAAAGAAAAVATIAIVGVGLAQVAAGLSTPGIVVAALVAARALGGPVRHLGLAHDYWQRARISKHKVRQFLSTSTRDLDPPGRSRLRLGARSAGVEFLGVHVRGALAGVDAVARAGEMVAIVGPPGSGKSTLLAVAAGLVDPDEGTVRIGGQDLSTVAPASVARRVGIVGPDLPLMRGTVRRNLTYRCRSASEDELQRAITACGLDALSLPGGLEGWITEGGMNLSAGERQRVAVARALMGNPPLLLLDEPTANLDAAAAARIRSLLARHNGTVLMVTRDPADAAIADRVWRMEEGRIVQDQDGETYRYAQWIPEQEGAPWITAAAT
jgi:ATP-binding cassette, subfamily B, bacterial